MKKIPIGILGATGMVGQQYVQLLANHPWFQINFLASSESSSGKPYSEAISNKYHISASIPPHLLNMRVERVDNIGLAKERCSFVFSAMNNEGAKIYEEMYAQSGIPVISNASFHRSTADVPILIPEVNPEHANIIPLQQKNRGWSSGFIVTKPNCSVQSYMIPLAPLHEKFKVKNMIVTTMQAVSGAGYPGVSSMDIIDNIIPYIQGEEEKSQQEPLKIWGCIKEGHIHPTSTVVISAQCNRVPVIDGHLACVSVKFEQKPSPEEILTLWQNYKGIGQKLELPSAPHQPIIYSTENERPQPKKDRLSGNGMSITVGRLRECPIFDYKFVGLSHNTIRGAAGGGILNAEFLLKQGLLHK